MDVERKLGYPALPPNARREESPGIPDRRAGEAVGPGVPLRSRTREAGRFSADEEIWRSIGEQPFRYSTSYENEDIHR